VELAGRRWSGLLNEHRRDVPELFEAEWQLALQRADSTLQELAQRKDARLCEAFDSLRRAVQAVKPAGRVPKFDALLSTASSEPQSEAHLDRVVRQVLLSMLEQRRTRAPGAGR
jgi:hypothetical protein